jgi:hypothetical protein
MEASTNKRIAAEKATKDAARLKQEEELKALRQKQEDIAKQLNKEARGKMAASNKKTLELTTKNEGNERH